MKKGAVTILVVCAVLVLLGIGLYVLNAKSGVKTADETAQENLIDEDSAFENEQQAQEQPIIEDTEEGGGEEQEAAPSEYQIFDPVLTYEGAYNGPLYATSEQIGDGYDIDLYMANLDRNGVNFFIGMFPVLGEQKEESLTTSSGLGYVINNVQKYPYRVVPFFNPGYGGAEIEDARIYGEELTTLYRDALVSSQSIAGNDLIKGFGEIETQEWSIRHNDPKVLQLTDLASSHNLNFMFHPIASKVSDVAAIIEKYPDTNFIIHLFREDLDKKRSEWADLLKEHDNLYFSIDAAHITNYQGNDILYDYYDKYGDSAASRYVSTVNANYDAILRDAVVDYRPLVVAAPDKILWGTEAGPEYSFEPEVYDVMIKISRDFIAQVSDDPAVQEAIGYKNALRVFGQGAVLEKDINVANTATWPLCTDEQMVACDTGCGVAEGEDDLTAEQEVCFNDCLFENQCIDPLD